MGNKVNREAIYENEYSCHLLIRVLDSDYLNWYRTRKILLCWKDDRHK